MSCTDSVERAGDEVSALEPPRRIQLRRQAGWRLPDNTVVVARPSRWGNDFRVGETVPVIGAGPGQQETLLITHSMAVSMHRRFVMRDSPAGRRFREEIRAELHGHNLACWCPEGAACHADVYLEVANTPEPARKTHKENAS